MTLLLVVDGVLGFLMGAGWSVAWLLWRRLRAERAQRVMMYVAAEAARQRLYRVGGRGNGWWPQQRGISRGR